ncbi:MAG TPA: hypothetical protein VGE74_08980 [Gemmata sp.]
MARIYVSKKEARGDYFPQLCMRCGQPADCEVSHTFAWMPAWVHVLLLCGLAPWLVVALITRKTMRIVAPMCRDHRGHWQFRLWYAWLGLPTWIGLIVLLIAVWKQVPKGAEGPLVLGVMVGMLLWLVIGLVLAHGAIKAAEITDRGMDVVNVHREFAEAWREGGGR